MLDLNDPRWALLQHAYGTAQDVPDLLRRIAAEAESTNPDHSGKANISPTPWDEVYSSLYHQDSIYSATFAALPHIVALAENAGPAFRLDTMILAGNIRIKGIPDLNIPLDLIEEFESSLCKVRKWSLDIFRHLTVDDPLDLPYVIQAFAGLRHPKNPCVYFIDRFVEGDYELEFDECPQCGEYFLVHMLKDGPATMLDIDSDEGRTKKISVDRTDYPKQLERGREILDSSADPTWQESETIQVLAALAAEKGATDLATRILDLDTNVECPHCGSEFVLADELK